MMSRKATVALTDRRWFDFLQRRAVRNRLDEVNFWRPLAQTTFHSLRPGDPFFFRLKSPVNAVAGYGFFAHATRLPIRLAWDAFGEANGDPTFDGFVRRIAEYRRITPEEVIGGSRELTCLILREVRFLHEGEWVGWGLPQDWGRNIVAYKNYDLEAGPGRLLSGLLVSPEPLDLEPVYKPRSVDERLRVERTMTLREGQGSFRVRVLDAYGRRCAVTGERAVPVLEAAHIQPYLGPASNHIQNGLTLRADLHRLFDEGYVTVTSEYRFEVSRRLRDEFDNGGEYYPLHGMKLTVVPRDPSARPSPAALEWHASQVFR